MPITLDKPTLLALMFLYTIATIIAGAILAVLVYIFARTGWLKGIRSHVETYIFWVKHSREAKHYIEKCDVPGCENKSKYDVCEEHFKY